MRMNDEWLFRYNRTAAAYKDSKENMHCKGPVYLTEAIGVHAISINAGRKKRVQLATGFPYKSLQHQRYMPGPQQSAISRAIYMKDRGLAKGLKPVT